MTIAEAIQFAVQERERLRRELEAVEQQLIDAGAILSITVASAQFLRRRGRTVIGSSVRARILALLSDGLDHQGRDIASRLPVKYDSVAAQLSRMAIEGDIVRVRNGWYRQARELPQSVDAVDPSAGIRES